MKDIVVLFFCCLAVLVDVEVSATPVQGKFYYTCKPLNQWNKHHDGGLMWIDDLISFLSHSFLVCFVRLLLRDPFCRFYRLPSGAGYKIYILGDFPADFTFRKS